MSSNIADHGNFSSGRGKASVKQFLKERLAAFVGMMPIAGLMAPRRAGLGRWRGCGGLLRRCITRTAFDDLVQLTAIEPHAATLRAIIYFYPLPVAHHERNLANRTGHSNAWVGHNQVSNVCGSIRSQKIRPAPSQTRCGPTSRSNVMIARGARPAAHT